MSKLKDLLKCLTHEGAKGVANYRTSGESAETIVDYIESRGGNAIAVRADIFEVDGCKKLVDMAVECFNQVVICIVGPGGGWHP